MLMGCTEGLETDYVDSSAFVSVGGILGNVLAEGAWSLEDHPETSETDHYPVTMLESVRDELAPKRGRILAHASGFIPTCGRGRVDQGCVSVHSSLS